MPLMHREANSTGEPRYDTGTLRKVAALAARLQNQKQETLTAREIEAIAAEAGLDPGFLQQALAQLAVERPLAELEKARRIEFGTLLVAFAFPLFWGSIAYWYGASLGPVMFFTLISPAALALLLGLLLGKKGAAFAVGVGLVTALLPTIVRFEGTVDPDPAVSAGAGAAYLFLGAPLAGTLFPTDADALRAARQLQEEIPQFNQAHNRLPQPFRIRCGVSAGEVAIEEGMPLGHLQSPVINRAAVLQKQAEPGAMVVSGELAAAALIELGALTPLPEPIAGEPAFSWQVGPQTDHPARRQ